MQFKKNAGVVTGDGKNVGHIDRVVIDPLTKEVTHVVVRKGVLFKEDKVVPVGLIESTTEDRVTLRRNGRALESLAPYEEKHFIAPGETEWSWGPTVDGGSPYAQPIYWYPPLAPVYPMGFVMETHKNIPAGTVALKEGARIVSSDDKHVGDVERVITDPAGDRVTHFVISQGTLLKEKKVVPASWVDRVEENAVYLAVGSETLERLHAYETG